MAKRPTFNELCEETVRTGGKGAQYASYLIGRAQKTGKSPLGIAIDDGRREIDKYEQRRDLEAVAKWRANVENAEEQGMLDGSFEMTYEGAQRIYEKIKESVRRKGTKVKRGDSSVSPLDLVDVLNKERDAGLMTTAYFVFDPELRERASEEGLYNAIRTIGSHGRSGYILPTRQGSSTVNYEDMLAPRIKELLEAIPEAKAKEHEEDIRAFKVLIHERAERDVFPIFQRNTNEAFSKLEELIATTKNEHLKTEYEALRDTYHRYLDFEVLGVNPDFVDPKTGEKGVLPALHQRIGIYGIVNNERFGIWNGGGTGKTGTVVLAQPLIERKLAEEGREFRRAVILCPNSAKDAWEKGLIGGNTERYLAEQQDILIINGERKTDKFLGRIRNAKWIVANYEQLTTPINGGERLLVDELVDLRPDLVVFDEAHNIKNQRTTTKGGESRDPTLTYSAAARFLALSSRHFIPLSAAPISNGLEDFANLYHLINPAECRDPSEFIDKVQGSPRVLYTFFKQKSMRIKADEINKELDWDENTEHVVLGSTQRRIYDHIIEYRPGNWVQQVRKALIDPRLVDPEVLKRAGVLGQISYRDSAKYRTLVDCLTADDGPVVIGDKFVVFTMLKEGVTQKGNRTLERRYREMGISEEYDKLQLERSLDVILEEALREKYDRNFEVGVLDGNVKSVEERKRIVSRLSSSLDGLICTIQTGGESQDFTAANWMYFMDMDWKPDTQDQAIWRELRKGQKKKVWIRHLKADYTVDEEEGVWDYHVGKKRAKADMAMDGRDPTPEEWEMIQDKGNKRFKDAVKRSIGGRSINVYEAEITSIDDFKTRKRESRSTSGTYGTGVLDYTTTDAQEVSRLIGQRPQKCWFDSDFVEFYMKTLGDLATPVTNLSRVADIVQRAKKGEIAFPTNILAEASGPSMLYEAYQQLAPLIGREGFVVPRIVDRDLSELMLSGGRNPNKVLGNMTGESSTLDSESFDMVDNGSLPLLGNPEQVYRSLLEAHRVLQPQGLLELIVKNKRFLEEDTSEGLIGFHAGLEKLGFEVLTDKNEGFAVDNRMIRRERERKGEHFAESYASKLSNTYLLLARKQDNPTDVNVNNFWFETIHPDEVKETKPKLRERKTKEPRQKERLPPTFFPDRKITVNARTGLVEKVERVGGS